MGPETSSDSLQTNGNTQNDSISTHSKHTRFRLKSDTNQTQIGRKKRKSGKSHAHSKGHKKVIEVDIGTEQNDDQYKYTAN